MRAYSIGLGLVLVAALVAALAACNKSSSGSAGPAGSAASSSTAAATTASAAKPTPSAKPSAAAAASTAAPAASGTVDPGEEAFCNKVTTKCPAEKTFVAECKSTMMKVSGDCTTALEAAYTCGMAHETCTADGKFEEKIMAPGGACAAEGAKLVACVAAAGGGGATNGGAPASTGVQECDDYLTKMQACLAKQNPAAASAAKAAMDQTRQTWMQTLQAPDGKESLKIVCGALMDGFDDANPDCK